VLSSTPLFATESVVVLSQPGEVLLIPRAATGGGQPAPVAVAAPVHAFDPATRRILTVGADGTIEVHELAPSA